MNRRRFLNVAGTTALATALPTMRCSKKTNHPNIVLIMADDIGFSDIGCYGAEINTPNLDSLAENGIRFRQFYNMAKCNPTRSSLLTGLYKGDERIRCTRGIRSESQLIMKLFFEGQDYEKA